MDTARQERPVPAQSGTHFEKPLQAGQATGVWLASAHHLHWPLWIGFGSTHAHAPQFASPTWGYRALYRTMSWGPNSPRPREAGRPMKKSPRWSWMDETISQSRGWPA